jgi:WD40 repeat protein
MVGGIAVSPDGTRIATASDDGTVRLWPMPEGESLHALPYDEMMERLRGLTNLRMVQDATQPTGYRLTAQPFPGWENLPVW